MKKWLVLLSLVMGLFPISGFAEWNADWTQRKKISINAVGITQAIVQPSVVVRLHSGNFDFTAVNIDGSDIRFIAQDDKTELKYFVEKFDAVNELAIIWVQIPQISSADKDAHFWLYYGNENAASTANPKIMLDSHLVAKFQFSDKALLQDSSPSGLFASGKITAQKAGLIGESAVLTGEALVIPANAATNASAGFTWSAWVKPSALPQTASLYSQENNVDLAIAAQNLTLKIAEIVLTGGELKPAVWQHIAFTLNAGKAVMYLNGVEVATGDVPTVDTATDIKIGEGFTGEVDELEIANIARSADFIKLIASSESVDSQLLKIAEGEGGEDGEEEGEANYLGILIDSLTLDAKIVIGILAVMFAISVWVMWSKAMLVSRTDKDNKRFLARFQKSNASDLLELDKGGKYPHSNLFKLYQAGLREIKKRQHEGEKLSLSGASMDAIKAAIDADLVRETQRQNAGMVLLTIAISGGPFLGLLGTVVGVMITFAAIAAAGDVNVNAIAPGIAAALLATVAGLAVAIPALFGYNYLASRIKNITIAMQIFVDEFVTRSAELFGKE
ncbi:MAG: flagellar motor protein MotA [Methylotenera sp.]|nr:MAG: flagellar motor protein MotA [Methylotenera sp.]